MTLQSHSWVYIRRMLFSLTYVSSLHGLRFKFQGLQYVNNI